ncbi:hypothetical protein D3C73_1301160 [compost metagenome]
MRVHTHALTRFRHFNRIEHANRLFKGFAFTHFLVLHQHFHQLLANTHIRVERSHWVLEDHRNLFCPQLVELFFRQVEDFAAVKFGRAANAAIAGQQPHQCESGLGFTGAGFTHDPQRFAGTQVKVKIVNGRHITVRSAEGHAQIFDIQ